MKKSFVWNMEKTVDEIKGLVDKGIDEWDIDDFAGSVRIGELCFDLVLREYYEGLRLDYDTYIGGIDTGYSYGENNYPYTYAGGGTVPYDMLKWSWGDFKQGVENMLEHDIEQNELLKKKSEAKLKMW